ncbi:hypothetical protein [Leucothrix pacifica]|uniref:Uncharacterized protein n=1 Tax=Leucothrix pacifica TaxID=1247513 RepID=A0A317CJE5_9GAMM|nr:hypothetical protein [Leucothrix pacifica]PWQ96450.1 hypothetical protein DKW60_12895 [Leucothrix pacifica]
MCNQKKAKGSFAVLLFLSMFMLMSSANAGIWQTKNQWSQAWEKRYQQWVAENWTTDFFMNPKKPIYNRVAHDCADAIYFMRMAFSYENKLPFAINNIMRPGELLTNDLKTWDRLPEQQRVRNFMKYVADRVGTRSLHLDTYPIALADIKAGDLYVEPGSHSYEITGITETGVTSIMSSTTPASPKMMVRLFAYPFFIPKDKKNMRDGYRRFKWPQNMKKPMQQQPGYSNEQYRIAEQVNYNYVAFTDIIAKKLRRRPEPLNEKTTRVLYGLCAFAKERVNYVNDGLNYVRKMRAGGRQCMNRTEYDYYSTPSRDKRLKMYFSEVEKIAYAGGALRRDEVSIELLARAIFHDQIPGHLNAELNRFCGLAAYPTNQKRFINLRQLWSNLNAGKVSSDPHAPIESRWGLTNTPYRATCPTY